MTPNGNAWTSMIKLDKFQPTPRFVVHTKADNLQDYTGTVKGHVAVVVVGSYRDELLVELPAPIVIGYEKLTYHYIAIRALATREGHRLTRTITRMVKMLAQLGRDGARKRSTADQLAARAAGRQGREGTCQICEGRQIVTKGKLVLHGYDRPGDGYINGRCYGVGHLPFEVSCDALKSWVVVLASRLTNRQEVLAAIPARTEILVVSPIRNRPATLLKIGDANFARAIAAFRADVESEIRSLDREIARQSARVAAWKLAA